MNLKPVAIEFEAFRDIERTPEKNLKKIGGAIHRAIGFILDEDDFTVRLAYRVEGIEREDYDVGPDYCSIVIPKDSIVTSGLPLDIEVINYLDHYSFGWSDSNKLVRHLPWKCTAYGRIHEETDKFVCLVHFEKDIEEKLEPKHDGVVILKSTILNRETFKAEDTD